MRRIATLRIARLLSLGFLLAGASSLFARVPDTYQITPDKSTMLVGESRTFRMVDQNGRAQTKVTWTLSDADAFESIVGDEIGLTPKRVGDFRLTARTDFATAEASVTVVEGTALPPGTVKWTSGAKKGCKTMKLLPAFPTANGPDFFEQSICEDGEYVAAYTSSGVQLWRRKISNNGMPPEQSGASYETLGNRMAPRTASVCDSAALGTDQQKIRELLAQRNLAFREEPLAVARGSSSNPTRNASFCLMRSPYW
jgi:hypothetical protein